MMQRLAYFLCFILLFTVFQLSHIHWKVIDSSLLLSSSWDQLTDEATYFQTRSARNKLFKQSKALGHRAAKKGRGHGDSVSSWRIPKSLEETEEAEVLPLSLESKTVPGGRNKKRQFRKRMAKYLEDVTEKEKFRIADTSSIPVIESLKKQHPNMYTRVIPPSRWPKLDNTTCITTSNKTWEDWEYRAPYALILGAQKAGSSALAKYLHSHRQIVPSRKELHFLSERMDYYNNDFDGIDQVQARSHYLSHMRSAMMNSSVEDLSLHPDMHLIDATPMYLPKSDRVPNRVLCLCPWARLIVLLREPISRTYSQFNMDAVHADLEKKLTGNGKSMAQLGTFDDVVQQDYDTLIQLGVLLPENATESERQRHYGSKKEFEAWKMYSKLGTLMPIGRSLYAIQLRHWINAYKVKNQPLRLLVINSDDMKERTESTYLKVLDFLKLPHELPKTFVEHHKHAYIVPMSATVRALLERVFEPYNRQLGDLLGPEWVDVWQYSKNTTNSIQQ